MLEEEFGVLNKIFLKKNRHYGGCEMLDAAELLLSNAHRLVS